MTSNLAIRSRVSQGAAGYLAVLIATACWGTSGIFVKYMVADGGITALALAFWRDISTFLVLLIGVLFVRPSLLRVQRRDLPWLAALGGSLAAMHVLWNLAVMLNGAAVATVQQAAMPAIVTIVAWITWREPLTQPKILAIILTFTGTVLVSGLDVLGQAELSLRGLLIGLAVPVCYAAWNLFGKKMRQHCHPFTLLTYSFGFAALALLPLQFFSPPPWPVPRITWLWFAGLVSLSTLIPFSFYIFALGRLPASIASIWAMTEIPFVAIYANLLLDERLTPNHILGAVLVAVGVLLLAKRNRT